MLCALVLRAGTLLKILILGTPLEAGTLIIVGPYRDRRVEGVPVFKYLHFV